ncbi:MAG: TlpA family protein disulfide reductase [Bacteriovoracaceae bacterium]
MTSSISFKLFLALVLSSGTLLYSHYHHNNMTTYFDKSEEYVLKELPNFALNEIYSKKQGELQDLLPKDSKGVLVHFWGTWCGPCEEELPSFMKLIESQKENKLTAVLFAINDDEAKVKSFLSKRIGKLPSNVLVAVDNEGNSLQKFGTLKVPETYAFNAQGIMVKKFVGPQEWDSVYFSDYLGSIFSKKQ